MEVSEIVMPIAYCAPVNYYQLLLKATNIQFELHEHLVKQTIRNRCYIYSPNGKQMLVIPLQRRSERTIMKDIKISYDSNWQTLHWRSLESAYRRSPYFEYFEDDLKPLYSNKNHTFLTDYNLACFETINSLLKIKANYTFTNEYNKELSNDYRTFFNSDKIISEAKPYSQVFDTKFGFIENLSILDLLFNQGSRATEYL